MPKKNGTPACALLVLVNGFDETGAVEILCTLRRAGSCVKSISLASGLVDGAHGIWLMPDWTLADLDAAVDIHTVRMVIFVQGNQGTSRLETEPRLHRLLQQVLAQGGHIAGSQDHGRIFRAADIISEIRFDDQIHLRSPEQSVEAFGRELACYLGPLGWKQRFARLSEMGRPWSGR